MHSLALRGKRNEAKRVRRGENGVQRSKGEINAQRRERAFPSKRESKCAENRRMVVRRFSRLHILRARRYPSKRITVWNLSADVITVPPRPIKIVCDSRIFFIFPCFFFICARVRSPLRYISFHASHGLRTDNIVLFASLVNQTISAAHVGGGFLIFLLERDLSAQISKVPKSTSFHVFPSFDVYIGKIYIATSFKY